MAEQIDKQLDQRELLPAEGLEPIGLRVLGNIDPKTLTREQFDDNAQILFHGAAKQFEFKRSFDYRSAEYYTDSDGSQTLGEGFYTTDILDAAENYSRTRSLNKETPPVIIKVLPYQAKVFDFRAESDPGKNAPVPLEIFNSWYEHYRSYFQDRRQQENLPWFVRDMEAEYYLFLVRAKKLVDSGELIDLRVMLGTHPFPKINAPNWPSPCYMKLFSNFMTKQNYDGLVYVEGGEGAKNTNSPSYVFYNLEKVGTFDSWQSKDSGRGSPR